LGVKKAKTEEEIRKRIPRLEKKMKTEGPFIEQKNIAREGSETSLKCVLEETDSLLSY